VLPEVSSSSESSNGAAVVLKNGLRLIVDRKYGLALELTEETSSTSDSSSLDENVTRPLLDGLNGLLVELEGASVVVVVEKLMRLRVKPGFLGETSS
jgi:hypothetical protein